jgi:hypothetical protein
MSLHDVWQLNLDFLPQKSICIEPVEENLSTDAGLLIFRQWDQQQGFTEGFTSQLDDPRREPEHSLLEMVRSRTFGILAGYEDQNDHDVLRTDAVFKLLADRLPEDDDLASQPTRMRRPSKSMPNCQGSTGRHDSWVRVLVHCRETHFSSAAHCPRKNRWTNTAE